MAAGSIAAHVSGRDNDSVQADGVVDFVDNTVDPTTGMITLKVRFDNADHTLWPGRFVNVDLRLGTEADQIVVPTPAVQTGQNGKQVYVMKADHTVELRPVTVGRIAGESTSISAGIAAGEIVVTDGQLRLVPGSHVEVRSLEEATKETLAQNK
jgi:multidrug efflux system membrane fusion protein